MTPPKVLYLVIPLKLMHDKSIDWGAKVLYGNICGLCESRGYCWAGNERLAEHHGTTTRSIRRWLRELKDAGYITVEITPGRSRRIMIAEVGTRVSTGEDARVLETPAPLIIDSTEYIAPRRKEKQQPQPTEAVSYEDLPQSERRATFKDGKLTIPPQLMALARRRFPAIDIPSEVKKMELWLLDHPDARNLGRRFLGWIGRATPPTDRASQGAQRTAKPIVEGVSAPTYQQSQSFFAERERKRLEYGR